MNRRLWGVHSPGLAAVIGRVKGVRRLVRASSPTRVDCVWGRADAGSALRDADDGYRPSMLNAYNFGLGLGPPSAALV